MFESVKIFFNQVKLFFTNKPRYNEHKRYMKLQKEYRKQLKKLAKEFCPWSGYYMHKMILTMLEFYYKTYEAKDCCWSESACTGKVAASLKKALDYADKLDALDDTELTELYALAQKDPSFDRWVDKRLKSYNWDAEPKESTRQYLAYSYLEEKYTKAMYDIIGKHIWEWMD